MQRYGVYPKYGSKSGGEVNLQQYNKYYGNYWYNLPREAVSNGK